MTYEQVMMNAGALGVMDIDTGKTQDLEPYASYDVEHVTHKDRDYLVLKGTRIGAVTTFWEQHDETGKIKLVPVPMHVEPKTWHGVTLPITSRTQVEDKLNLVIFHGVKGKMLCNKCSLKHSLTTPNAVAFYLTNILPYSQDCHQCGTLFVNCWQSKAGGPLILFPKFVQPKKGK